MHPLDKTVQTWVVSSQKRIFRETMPEADMAEVCGLRNEPISFQLAYRTNAEPNDKGFSPDIPISVQVTSATLPLQAYRIGNVCLAAAGCEDAPVGAEGMCPDRLLLRQACPEVLRLEGETHIPYIEKDEMQPLMPNCLETKGLWITVNEDGVPLEAGVHEVRLKVISLWSGEVLREHTVQVELLDALLPENDLIYTNWMHYDCLAQSSGLPVWSDEYFALLGRYLRNAAKHGMTAVLTPAFTPALDTPVGHCRQNVQLVGVKRDEKGYHFDFSLLERFVRTAMENGIQYFEHCHLYSQWGLKSAINIFGEENGRQKQLFGWDTPAQSPEYVEFLQAYLPAFLAFAKKVGIRDKLLMHISDEPSKLHAENYAKARAVVKPLLEGLDISDALSHYELYETGLVELPIVNIPKAPDFDGKCGKWMLYYTGGEGQPTVSRRLLNSAPWRTRILGVQLFRYDVMGFLHWGYNYYFGNMSHVLFDPVTEPDGYRNSPGAPYLVYPGKGGEPIPSMREKQMGMAISDYRALRLLESRIGREKTLALCERVLDGPMDWLTLPESGERMLALRTAINEAIRETIG